MVGRLWSVEWGDAVEIWEDANRPTYDDLEAMKVGMMQWELYGPPTPEKDYQNGHYRARGPLGSTVFYRQFDTPGEPISGYILVLGIAT
ncbi:MAG: hypothetical protein M3256_02205 [Actinomycetota bacterium]|nr:hypothetical protein [Actinomycetota bacterium]